MEWFEQPNEGCLPSQLEQVEGQSTSRLFGRRSPPTAEIADFVNMTKCADDVSLPTAHRLLVSAPLGMPARKTRANEWSTLDVNVYCTVP